MLVFVALLALIPGILLILVVVGSTVWNPDDRALEPAWDARSGRPYLT